ncbi:hypothetical protein LCGC14_2801140 [marine sediment metagenome]|uniref:Uncharacterized protein n=1 Tax=marine sediment metagenome TaxID=412755 RepID=A0A0F8YML7_9ZZZZ
MAKKWTRKQIENSRRFVGVVEEFKFISDSEDDVDIIVAKESKQEEDE